MDEGSSEKKCKAPDAVISEANPGAIGSTLNSSAAESSRVEKKIDELGAKLEKLFEQVKALQAPQHEQKLANASANSEAEKKPEGAQQSKTQDVIYVRKPNEFSFYS